MSKKLLTDQARLQHQQHPLPFDILLYVFRVKHRCLASLTTILGLGIRDARVADLQAPRPTKLALPARARTYAIASTYAEAAIEVILCIPTKSCLCTLSPISASVGTPSEQHFRARPGRQPISNYATPRRHAGDFHSPVTARKFATPIS